MYGILNLHTAHTLVGSLQHIYPTILDITELKQSLGLLGYLLSCARYFGICEWILVILLVIISNYLS